MGKVGVIVAARSGSARLPGKALLPLLNLPMVVFLLRRLRGSRRAQQIVFATTTLPQDDRLAEIVASEGLPVFRGASEDVVQRYVEAAQVYDLAYVVRVTGDCPFVDAETLDYCLECCERFGSFDIASTKSAFPVGIDYEIYNAEVLARLHHGDKLSPTDREHVTKYFYDHANEFEVRRIEPLPEWNWHEKVFTIDTPADYEFAQRLVAQFDTLDFRVAALLEAARCAV